MDRWLLDKKLQVEVGILELFKIFRVLIPFSQFQNFAKKFLFHSFKKKKEGIKKL